MKGKSENVPILRLKSVALTILLSFLLIAASLNLSPILFPKAYAENTSNHLFWLNIARIAWNYFQPGKGVNAVTGLHGASLYYPIFTDWDLGSYIQAIIEAKNLGLLSDDGSWGIDARLDKILTFLETRPLTPDRQPFNRYLAESGSNYNNNTQDPVDAGKLLVALNNLRAFKPNLTTRINNVVYNITNYEPLCEVVDAFSNSVNIYLYYSTMGFAAFWPGRFSSIASSILDVIIAAPPISTYGTILPKAYLTCEPLLLSTFELPLDLRLQNLTTLVYLAHEAKHIATGKNVAFSEGNTYSGQYIYEWVVLPDGQTWKIENTAGTIIQIPEISYLKVAISFLALYNTTFTQSMVNSMMTKIAGVNPSLSGGHLDGIDENERVIQGTIGNSNSLILSASRYAIENSQSNPTASPTPLVSPYSTPASTPTPRGTLHGYTASPTPTSYATSTPYPTTTPEPSASATSSPAPTDQKATDSSMASYPAIIVGITAIVAIFTAAFKKVKKQPK